MPRHSELFARISLPPSDDRAMPPSGKTPLTEDEVTVIRLWIAGGASASLPRRGQGRAQAGASLSIIPELDPARGGKAARAAGGGGAAAAAAASRRD